MLSLASHPSFGRIDGRRKTNGRPRKSKSLPGQIRPDCPSSSSLRIIQSDTAAQVGLLEQASRAPGAFTDIEATQMTTAYCVQPAEFEADTEAVLNILVSCR
ncbi:hypothetical protein [Massilia antarctica]|uniref:hypothetical protein n=1 Tax=Massilia antarctica TaxID=2765360 RepID=UPI0006BCB41F|nr:hypothetical protein [Massilia sp. H27-R4]MCY0914617.1 hypothetical protein [Massilia sp. H27-R4]CUI02984.1 hypothetical protein BN2497_745 [Janthinobacterium sp. CG23_2]CUU26770.1 hypothetical protein BN3177_745 [Janthinobacterium sp. CG23_2]